MARKIERRDSDTRDRILAASISIIAADGSANLRMADVADVATVGVPTIYYYFSSRENLVAAAQAERFRHLLDGDRALLEDLRTHLENKDLEAWLETSDLLSGRYWGAIVTELIWEIIEIFADIRREEQVRIEVGTVVRDALAFRAETFRMAQENGWADDTIDPLSWVTYFFGATLGQVIADLHPDLRADPEGATRLRMRMHSQAFTEEALTPRQRG
jgi:AcrR family transcriptional regulator